MLIRHQFPLCDQIKEEVRTGGGATGQAFVPPPIAKDALAKLPNSKAIVNQSPPAIVVPAGQCGDKDETDAANNTKAVGNHAGSNKASVRVGVKESIDAMFAGSELSEEFKTKATTVFEAAIGAEVSAIVEEMNTSLTEQVEAIKATLTTELTEKVDTYLSYTAMEWLKENQVAVEASLRTELMEEFITGLQGLFAQHYIEIPEDKVDVVEQLAAKVAELEERHNALVTENIALKGKVTATDKDAIVAESIVGLAQTQAEKLETLAEAVEFTTPEEFKVKIGVIKEQFFGKPAAVAKPAVIDEAGAGAGEDPAADGAVKAAPTLTGQMAAYVSHISHAVKN